MAGAVSSPRNALSALTATAPPVMAILLGVFIIYGVGFAGSSVIHNAAHDVRHAYAFPCH